MKGTNDITGVNMNGDVTRVITFSSSTNELKQRITQLLDELVRKTAKYTLAELGYLHMSTVSYVDDHVDVKVYFDAKLASVEQALPNGKRSYVPTNKLDECFQNYLYVGKAVDIASYDEADVPKYRIEEDDLGKPAIVISDKKSTDTSVVLVLHCNLDLVISSILDINPFSEGFEINTKTVGKYSSKKSDKHRIIIAAGANPEFPVDVEVTFNPNAISEYDPELAIPYLVAKVNNVRSGNETRHELVKKVTKDGKKRMDKAVKETEYWRKYR